MTQATVNGGNSTVKNLNPDAQLFSSSDFNNGTVLAGSTAPSDDSYADYIDNGTGSYLRQHQSHIYPVDPSSIDTLQQQQQTESNFAIHEHGAMLDTIDHQQTPLLNPNHLHHPQSHMHQTMPNEEQAQQIQLTPEQLRQHLRKQLEYYFSRENMIHDTYLKSKMDADDYVPIAIIANFKLVKRLTHNIQLIIDVLKELPSVEVDPEERKVRSAEDKKLRSTGKRCIIILRDVPLDATETEVSELFLNEHCPIPPVACERALESGTSDCWYVTFNSEDDAQNAFLYLTRENVSIRGQKVLARMKARLWQKQSSVPSTNPSTPVSPPITGNNSGATSPPPPQQQSQTQQQQQQPIQTYQNSAFVPQQQAPPPPPQYQSHPQQQQFNQQQIPQQQQHPSVYMQTATNAHPNQTSILGNIQSQTNNYRHPIHPSVAQPPPPQQHVPTQFSTANQSQHPTSLEHAQVLQQHLRMSYPSYPTNTPFDRATWTTAHPQNVQATQQALSFATSAQQANLTSYPGSIHQQPQFIANHAVFPGGNLWYMPSPAYQTADPYPTMAYNGAGKPKTRMTREYPVSSKSRNSAKPPGARNSRHEGLQMNNDHSNELLDYCQHSTPHSEGSSSPVPRAEAVINRTNEPIAQPVSNTSLQHVQAYPTTTIDTSANDNIDHYHHHQSPNDILYNNANSHIQQQGSSEINPSQEQTNDSQNLGKFPNQSSYANSTSIDNSKLNYQPLEQRKPPSVNPDSQQHSSLNENQQQQSNKKANSQQASIRPLMPRENRSNQNSNRPQSSQQGRSQQQQQQSRTNPNSSTPLSVTIPKVSSATYYNQTSSSPQSPNSNQKNQQQQQQQQQQVIDNNGPRTYADMLKLKQAPQQQQQTESTKSPTNETNNLSSSRAQSPINNTNNNTNPKTDSVSVNAEPNGPISSSSSDISPSNQTETPIPSQSSTINDTNPARRNSSASDHPQQQHSSSPSHQQYNNPRGRGGGRGGGGGGNYRFANDRRSGSSNSLNRGGGGGGGGRGGGRRPVNNNSGSNGPPTYQPRGNGGRGNGRFFDRSRGGGGNYHNSNQSVHRFTGNTGNVEPQVHYAE